MIGKLREKKEKILSGLRLTQRRLTAMEAMRKKIPSIEPQLQALRDAKRSADRALAMTEESIEKAKVDLKEAIVARKKAMADQQYMQKQMDKADAMEALMDTASADNIYENMADSDGSVTLLCFLKALHNAEVASFFNIEAVSHQEDASRDLAVKKFQEISGHNKSFDKEVFLNWVTCFRQ